MRLVKSDVRFTPKADIEWRSPNVRLAPILDTTGHYSITRQRDEERRGRCCSSSGHCGAKLLFVARRPGRIRTPARPLQRSIGDQGLHECPRPSRPAKWGVREGPPRFLPLQLHRFQSQLACCRGSREEAFSYPQLCWLGTARQLNPISIWKPHLPKRFGVSKIILRKARVSTL